MTPTAVAGDVARDKGWLKTGGRIPDEGSHTGHSLYGRSFTQFHFTLIATLQDGLGLTPELVYVDENHALDSFKVVLPLVYL